MKITSSHLNLLFIILCFVILLLSIRGITGNPSSQELNSSKWIENGPFELSPERGRFSLLYSIIEDKSLEFSDQIGKFAKPDVAVINGKYVSLFAPLLSFLVIPGYVIGKYFGVAQVGAFAVVSIFAILNLILLRLIAIRLGANSLAASIASLVFLFATPSFTYAVTLYQHHISTFLILISIYTLLKYKTVKSLIMVFFATACAISLDYPNLIFMFPILLFAIARIISFEKIKDKLIFRVNLFKMAAFLAMVIPILFFLWFNQTSYGNPFQLSGTLYTPASSQNTRDNTFLSNTRIKKNESREKTAVGFFNTRNIVNGFYILFISPDRGVIYFAPVILFGVIGFLLALKKRVQMIYLLTAISGVNILLYSMWADPWGGWAFGSRYLIPSYAILSIFIALLITWWRKKVFFWAIFILILFYSIAVNALGAVTTNAIPPKPEVLNLEKVSGVVQKYTYEKNWDFLVSGRSKSFVYQTFANNFLTSLQYYQIIVAAVFVLTGGLIFYYVVFWKGKYTNV